MTNDSTPTSTAPTSANIHAARRRIQDQLEVEPTASTVDGRTFSYEAPVRLAMPAGEFATITATDGRTWLGRVLDTEVVEREGPAFEVAGDAGLGAGQGLESLQVTGMTFRLRLQHAHGHGVLIGQIEQDRIVGSGPDDRFDRATITSAGPDRIASFLSALDAGRTRLDVGTLAGFDRDLPAAMLAGGFGRHTFLVGQSGSGKTYSLGVVLERLLLDTDLRIIIVDPNSDYVRLADLHEKAAPESPDVTARYREAVAGVRVLRPAGRATSEDNTLRIRFSDLSERVQALVLRIDPLENREEFDAFRTIVRQMETDHYSLHDVQAAALGNLSAESRRIALRIAALGNSNWDLWAETGQPSLRDIGDDWRALILDVGGFEQPEEKSLVANAVLQSLWARRDQRQPVLVVIDEAHNICPQEPDDPIQEMATQRAISIAAEGRKYGLYLLLSTQRPSKIHINILSQCDNLMLMRMNSESDLQHLAQVFSFVPETLLARSTTFAQGESLIAGKISPVPLLIRFGQRFSQEGGSDVPDTWTRNR
jgi:uncharacterized protein